MHQNFFILHLEFLLMMLIFFFRSSFFFRSITKSHRFHITIHIRHTKKIHTQTHMYIRICSQCEFEKHFQIEHFCIILSIIHSCVCNESHPQYSNIVESHKFSTVRTLSSFFCTKFSIQLFVCISYHFCYQAQQFSHISFFFNFIKQSTVHCYH